MSDSRPESRPAANARGSISPAAAPRAPRPSTSPGATLRTPRRAALAIGVFALAVSIGTALAADRWIHVSVDEKGSDGQRVRVNVPLSVVEKIIPQIQDEHMSEGKLHLGDEEFDKVDLKAMWNALKETGDAEFVTIEGADQNVRVAREGDYFVVKVRESGEKRSTVDARLPLDVVDALMTGDGDELDLSAALRVLSRHEGDLVTVNDEDSHVRIWIDGRNTQPR
jgi:hypothetical protein